MLQLKRLSSDQIDIERWKPASVEEVFLSITLEIGFDDGLAGTNLFYATIATPEALKARRKAGGSVDDGIIVIHDFDSLLCEIRGILDDCSRKTWEESCIALRRHFQWEYEDYQEDSLGSE